MNNELTITPEQDLYVMGTRCRTVVSGEQTNRMLSIVHIDAPEKGVGVPAHVHDLEDETFHVLEGRVRFTIAGQERIASAGQTVFGPRGVVHAWVALEPSKFVVSVTPAGVEEMFVELAALGAGQAEIEKVIAVCKRYAIHFT